MCLVSCHGHTDYSNIRLLDSTNSVEDLILTSVKLGHRGVAITDHETVSAHVQAIQKTRELKKKGKIPQDFKLLLGNEIYLCDSLEEIRDNYQPGGVTKFPHFLLISKNKEGHEQLRYLSSLAWSNSFYTGIMERVPTMKEDLKRVVAENPGHLISSTACLGSESSIHLLAIREAELNNDSEKSDYHRLKLHDFFTYCIEVFGKENFFVELQPAVSEEQKYVNQKLIPIADYYGLKRIITTDTHYARPEDRAIHSAYLNSKEGDRETDSFYMDCYAHTVEEIYEKMDYIDRSIVEDAINNTLLIGEMVEDYTIENEIVIPKIDLPQFDLRHLFERGYEKYTYIKKMANSENEQDQYLMKLIEDGFEEKLCGNTLSRESFHEILQRLDDELGELWEISKSLNQSMPSYYITVREIINIIWEDDECGGNSLVGVARGSAAGFLVNYLLDITQINPITYNLPHWRHLHKSRPDMPDIDIDTEGGKRERILQALKNKFGEHRVLQIATFGTDGSKSALQTACRGLGIDSDTAQYLSGMIPFERGQNWSLNDCLFGNEEEGRKPVKELIREINEFPDLKETALKVEGLINKRSSHAAGIIVFNDHYVKTSAMMKTPKGASITQFNMGDVEAMGNVKYDLLTIEALDKIRVTLDQLLEDKVIQSQGNLKKTYNKYIHPDVLEYNDRRLWEMVGKGEVMDLFQFSTAIGYDSVLKVKPSNLLEAAVTNSLMRLMADGEEQPVDTYVRFKNDISLWYKEMRDYGLNEDEIKVMERHLKDIHGVADTQEVVMQMVMDEDIANFDIKGSNKIRKAIAKKKEDVLNEVKEMFFTKGRENGTSDNLLNYCWNVQFKRQFGYSFSLLHTLAYSVIALQELNLNLHYSPLYWNTSVLTVNSGGTEDTSDDDSKKAKATNYGKVASAIGKARQRGVRISLPDINKAKFGFKTDVENDTIVYGLKGLIGINDEIVNTIISNRPYNSFEHFLEKLYSTNLIKKSQVVQLIKAGCFDQIDDRVEIMKRFSNVIAEPKSKLTMANVNMMLDYGLIPEEYAFEVRLIKFKDYISKKVFKVVNKPKDKLFILDHVSTPFFNEHFDEDCIVEVYDNQLVISEKLFKKEFEKKIQTLKDYISTDEALDALNNALLNAEYENHFKGSLSKGEMDSLCFYYHSHELAHVDKLRYGIVDYFELDEEPKITSTKQWRGRDIHNYETYRIVGTVLDKDKTKHTITLLTDTGVVIVKNYGGSFSHYNKQISKTVNGKKEVIEKSWYSRGNLLMFTGFRRGNQFVCKSYKDSIYQETHCLIEGIDQAGHLTLRTERAEV